MNQTKKIFMQHDNIERVQYKSFYPQTPADLNTPNRKINFTIYCDDNFSKKEINITYSWNIFPKMQLNCM